jgi:hypothetical protein
MASLLDQFNLFLNVGHGLAEVLDDVTFVPGPPQVLHGVAPEIVEMLQDIPGLHAGNLGPIMPRLANYIFDFQ